VLLPGDSKHSAGHLFELLPKRLELHDPMLNGGKLFLNKCEQLWTQLGTGRAVECAGEHPQSPKWQPQRARSADEVQPLYGRLFVLPIARRSTPRDRKHSDLFVVADRLCRHAGLLGDLTDGDVSHRFLLANSRLT
jgi:hypothetical protein